ncbi:MAG TPA: cysteine peptidase family C39 domain-containing protein, partial [Puia sp.]|nr:cysteine peptidase family C39 domain-containing protein [Puia sp.]
MKKKVEVSQQDASDCGAACLASVAAYYGLQLPISRLRQHAGTNKQGTTIQGMIDAAERISFEAKGARAKPEKLP